MPDWVIDGGRWCLEAVLAVIVAVQTFILKKSKAELNEAKAGRAAKQGDEAGARAAAVTIGAMEDAMTALREEIHHIRTEASTETTRLKAENRGQAEQMVAMGDKIRELDAAHQDCEKKNAAMSDQLTEVELNLRSHQSHVKALEQKLEALEKRRG